MLKLRTSLYELLNLYILELISSALFYCHSVFKNNVENLKGTIKKIRIYVRRILYPLTFDHYIYILMNIFN